MSINPELLFVIMLRKNGAYTECYIGVWVLFFSQILNPHFQLNHISLINSQK